jgi:hypothetical protein
MKVGEFAERACALSISKKTRFEAAFERAKRELHLLDVTASLQPSVPTVARRPRLNRPILSLPIRRGT